MIKQTTLQNILTWVIAVVLFIFQSLNYFIAWIKKYVIHGQKTTTVVTADTTTSSESNLNNSNVPENVITVQGLIQKHFDIPLIIAEDEPKVYSFIKNAKLLTSNEICKEKTKIDQFMENLVDDSYVARGLGLITATVGRQSEFYLYSKYDKNFENIVIRLNGRNGEIGQITILSKNHENMVKPKSIPMNYFYDKDRIKVTYTPFAEGVYTLTLERNSLSICRSPYYISVEKSPTNSRSQIRLGTKKYKPVTKFAKSKNSSLDTCDNSIPVIEPNKPSTCKTILPESEKNSIRTDVMSIVTKFESNSIHFQNKVHKSTSNISEKELETNLVDDIPKYPNIPPKIETDKIHDTYFSNLNSPSIHSKTISTDNNFWNDVDITYKNSKASDTNTINFKSELIKKPTTKLNKCIGITKDIPEVKNVSSTHLQSTNMVLVESLKIGNSRDVEKDNQTFKTIELMEENKHIEKHLDYKARINDTEIKCIDDEPCIQNEVSCFDEEDRKTVVVTKNSNEIESNLNDTVIQQITDSAQYNINTPFTSVITKITNSICEKCSIEVLKIISEFPRDINIAHKNYSNEMRSSFETLLAQPNNININIDNMCEHPSIATNERDSENILNISPTKIKRIDKIDKGIKCSYLNEIEPIDNNSDERCDKQCDDISNMSKELMIKQNKDNGKIDKTLKDKIFDHCIVPFTEHTIDKHNTGCQNNELSKNEIMKIKYSTTNEENVLHSNQFYNNTIHKSDSKMEIQRQHLQKSLEHSIDLIKTNQFYENINEELNLLSKESDKPLDTSDLITIYNDKNTNYELVKDEFKINNVIIPDENTNIQCSVINNIVLATSEYKSEDNEKQTNNKSYNNVTLTSIQNENQKSMIEKSIEPVLTSFKNKMVEKITQLYLNMDLSNTDNTSTFETHDKHLTNDLPEIKINNNANSTEINLKCNETVTSQLKNHIDKNEISEIILDQQKTDDNYLFKYDENIIKTKINPCGLYAKTLGEKKLQTLVNTAMNYQNDQQIDNEFKRMIIDNEIQDEELKKINDNEIVQDIEAMLVETPNVKIIKNSDELILSKNEVTFKRQCKFPLINDFDSIKVEKTNTDSKQEMQTINVNENDTIVDTNAVEIKALQNFKKSYNTEIITPTIEHHPTIKTQVMNTSELVTVEKHSPKEIQTTSEIIDSINIHDEANAVENINDTNEYESVKLHFKENVIIKIPHLVEKETLNKVVENISTNISAKSNSTEHLSLQTEIESPGLKKVYSANDVTIESDIIYKLPSLNKAENIVNDKLNPKNIRTPNAQVSKNAAKITIGINTSDQQFSNTAITVLIPSQIPTIEPIDSQSESDKKVNEMLIYTEADTPTVIDTSTASLVCKIMVEFVKKKNKTPIEELEIIAHEQIEEDTETVREITSTMNSLIAVMDEQVYMKKYGSDSYYEKSDNYITNTETKTQKSIGQNNAGKYTEKESPAPISTLTGVVMENLKANIVTANAIILCTNSSTETVDVKTVAEKVVEEESPSPINSLVELLQKNMTTNINTENVILPIESIEEPTIEDIIEPEITSCTESSTEITDSQNHTEKIVDPKRPLLINSSDEVVGESKISKILMCINSSTDNLVVQTDIEKVIEEESNSPINSLGELVHKNMNINISTEEETLLSIESIEEPKVRDITEPEITSCTESSTEITDSQNHTEKIVDPKRPLLINSSDEVVGESKISKILMCINSSTDNLVVQTDIEKVIEEESNSPINSLGELVHKNMNINISTEEETLLSIESIEEPKVRDITEPEITSCTESSTEITDIQNHTEKIVDPKLPLLINSSDEVVGESKISKILLCIDSSTDNLVVQTDIEKVIEEESNSPINSLEELVHKNMNINISTEEETLLSIESIEEPKVRNITEPEITSCTESSTEITDSQNHTEKIVDPKLPLLINSSDEVVGDSKISKILLYIDSSTDSLVVQTDIEKVIEEESNSPINSLGELVHKNMNINISTEEETLLSIESIEEPKVRDITEPEITSCTESSNEMTDSQNHAEKIVDPKLPLLISSDEVVGESKISKILLCIDSSTDNLLVPTYIEKVIEEESNSPINSLGELVHKNMNINISTEEETLLSIESIEEPKFRDITEPEITSCTESSNEMTDSQNHTENIVDPKLPLLINSSDEVVGKSKISKILLCIDSSTDNLVVQTDIDKVIEEESNSPINSLGELVHKNMNINISTEEETLLSIESIEEPKVRDITEPEITSCTESSTEITDSQNHTEKIVDPKLPLLINSSDEVVGESKISKILLYIDSSTDSLVVQTDIEKVIEEESNSPINYLGELVHKNMNINISTEEETLLSIESIEEPKVRDITEPEITSCTESSTEITDSQNHTEKIVDPKLPLLINSSDEVVRESKISKILLCIDSSTDNLVVQTDIEKVIEEESNSPINSLSELVHKNMNINISTEEETLLSIESIEEPKVRDITEPEITSCTESSTEITDSQNHTEKIVDPKLPLLINSSDEVVGKSKISKILLYIDSSTDNLVAQTDIDKVIEEESNSPINSLGELVHKNMNINISTEEETLLSIESIEEPKVRDITEPEITSCTESSTEITDSQNHTEKIVDPKLPLLINSSDEVVGESKISKILLYIDSSTDSLVVQTDIEKVIEEESNSPINSLGELVHKNMNINISTEYETLLSIESIEEPKIRDITEPEITSCTESSTGITDSQNHTEKIVDPKLPLLINSSNEVVGESKISKILLCIDSSTDNLVVQTDIEKVIEEESNSPINSLGELVHKNMNINISTEEETLLSIESIEEPKVRDITEPEITSCTESSTEITVSQNHTEKIVDPKLPLLINSSDEVVGESKISKILLCIDSSTDNLVVQTDIEKVIEGESKSPINSLGELVHKNMNINISTEEETLLSIESIEEPKVRDITEPEITSCTESSNEITDSQNHTEKIVDPKLPLLINSSDEVVGKSKISKILLCIDSSTDNLVVQTDIDKVIEEESNSPINSLGELVHKNMNINISTEEETLLSIESIEEPKVRDITEPEITSCTESSTEITDSQNHTEKIVDPKLPLLINSSDEVVGESKISKILLYIDSSTDSLVVQTDIEKVIEEESNSPINSLGELVHKNMNINISTEYETLLSIESIEEPKIRDITEPEITSCTESSTGITDSQNHTEKIVDPKLPLLINSSNEVVGESKISKILLCIDSSTDNLVVQTDIEKVIEEESNSPINSLGELVHKNMNINISTEEETLLSIESIEEPKVRDITEPEITSCTESSTEITDSQNHTEKIVDPKLPLLINSSDEVVGESKISKILLCIDSSTDNLVVQTDIEKVIEGESKSPINSLGELVHKNMNINISTEEETLLSIESIEEPKVRDITEPEITSCTESSNEMTDSQNHAEKIVDPKLPLLISSDEVVGESKISKILLCIDSSTDNLVVQTDIEKVIEGESKSPINSLGELVHKNMNINISTEEETLLSIESIEEPKVRDITEPEITSCTESSTEITDSQNHTEKIVDPKLPLLINSSDEVVGESKISKILLYIDSSTDSLVVQTDIEKVIEEESNSPINSLGELVHKNMNINISTEYETLLSIESIEEPKIRDITEPEITSCTESSTGITDSQNHTEKIVDPKLPLLINSSNEVVGESKISKILLCIDSSTDNLVVQTDIEKVIEEESNSPINSLGELVHKNMNINISTEEETLLSIESIEEPKVRDITEPEITSCTESSTEITDSQNHTEKIVDPKLPLLINSSDEVVGESKISKILLCIDSSTDNLVVQTDIEKVIEGESKSPINSLGELVHKNMNINISTEEETLLSIESIEEPKVRDITEPEITSCTESSNEMTDSQNHAEKIVDPKLPLLISSDEVVGESKISKILLCIDSSTDNLVVQTDIEKVIEGESKSPINSLGELVHKNMNINISTEEETLLSIESIEEPKVRDITEPEITSCTEFEIFDNQYHEEKIVDVVPNNFLSEVIGENMNKEIVTVSETLLSIGSTNESILESKVEEDITVIVDVQTDIEKVIEEESPFPMKFVCEVLQENTNPNINTKNEALLQMDTHTSSVEEMKEIDEIIGIDIETENETLLSIENTSVEVRMDEVDKITQNSLLVDFSAATELNGYEIVTNKETETSTLIDTLNTMVDRQTVKENFKEIVTRKQIATSTAFEEEQKSVEPTTVIENVLIVGTSTAPVEEEIQIEEVIKNKSTTLISYSTIHDVAALEEPKINKNETSAMRYSDTAMEEQTGVAAAEVVIDTYNDFLDKTVIEKGTHNETPTPIDILITVTDKQIHLDKVAENEIPILVNTSTESVEKPIKTEKVTENETITQIACETISKIETDEFEAESENKTSTPTNNSVLIAIKQTEVENLTERTLQNDDIVYKNTKTNFIGKENKTENSDNPNNFYLKFGETSKINHLENEDNLQRKSYGIQKLEMSVQRTLKTSDEDYYKKTFVQLEQTEQISKVDNIDSENKTVIDDKLYTVNESDLNAILCASSLEEALTLLDSKIKFKFKRKKSSSKINSVEYSPKIQTTDGNSSGVNTNFTDAREFFKKIEKKYKK